MKKPNNDKTRISPFDMKILFCNYEYPPLGGGGGVVNAMLAEELSKKHEVTVLTSSGFNLVDDEVVNGVRVVRVPVYVRTEQAAANFPSMAAYMINGIKYGKQLIRENQFDIINTHFALPTGPVGNALAKFSGLPNVLSVHGGDLYDPSKFTSPHRHWLLRTWVKSLLRNAEAIVGQSNNTLENVGKYYSQSFDTKLIPLGIHRPNYVEKSRQDLGLTDEDTVLSTVGRLVSRKGLDRLLNIISRLAIKNLKLLVIGSGPLEDELKEKANELGLQGKVLFQGFVEEEHKFQLLKTSDLYVSSSQHEGFGLVFLEAMATELPVICYDHGGQADFLEHGVTGGLLPLNDEAGFEKTLHELVIDDTKRKQIGLDNKEKVESYYIDACASQYEILFDSLVK